jgi:hypothetical protein
VTALLILKLMLSGNIHFNFRIQEFEEKLKKKDSEITEKNEAFVTLKKQCEM